MSCGSDLASGQAASRRLRSPRPRYLPEERRTVTVLFADLSGYTAIAERLDPEAVKALVDRFLGRLGEEVERVGGRVDKYMGDAVMAIFGAPVAHEDDPERAVRAAVGMQAAMGELNQRLLSDYGIEFALCIGINTGEVLAGKVGEDYTVIGDAVNVASRLQTSASPGTITVGERTQRATSGVVEYLPLEPLELKGKTEPVAAWRAVRLSEQHTGVARRSHREAPLVGRQDEFAALQMLVTRVTRHSGPHLATVFGQAGVGKTRLLRELEHSLDTRDPPVRVRRGRCLSFGSSVVYWPLSEMLRAECEIVDGDPMEVAWSKLSARMGSLLSNGGGKDEVARRIAPLARLLGIEAPGVASTPEGEDAQSTREAFFGAVRAYLEALAAGEPLVLAWEDIHWADEGMLDLIEYLSQWLRAPVLQVCLARDELLERRPGWGACVVRPRACLDPLAPGTNARADRCAAATPAPNPRSSICSPSAPGQSAVRRGDGPAACRGREQQGGGAARHGAGAARRAPGFTRARSSAISCTRGRRRPGLLGGCARAGRGGEGGDLQAATAEPA